MLKGRIIENISNLYIVSSDNKLFELNVRGRFRYDKTTPLVGDIVSFDEHVIKEIEPRKNELPRPRVSNIDNLLIVVSLKEPDFSSMLLDKEITLSYLHYIIPVICFIKLDLVHILDFKDIIDYYIKLGIKVFYNNNLDELKNYLQGKVVALTGQSGAGKSTLLNRLDNNLNIKTDKIYYALNRGNNTTRHVKMYNIDDIYFIDTPGFSSLTFENYTKEDIRNAFIEFRNYQCKFKDCLHVKEKDCKVKEALLNKEILLSRYNNYIKILDKIRK